MSYTCGLKSRIFKISLYKEFFFYFLSHILFVCKAFALLVEMVPEPVAARLTETLDIPTIGIGAGARCDGQVLVWSDMAGMTSWRPRFAKQFGQVGEALHQAAVDYGQAVRAGTFPAKEHWFDS